jgi:hypothetical protein
MLNTVITKLAIADLNEEAKKKLLITCPHCKAQYLPGEIYMPGALIGEPREVVKDPSGTIVYVDYHKVDKMPNMAESFVCEYCDQPFEVEATITYKTKEAAPEINFKQTYVSLID